MDAGEIARIKAMPAFQELVRKRSSFSWALTILMIAVYFAFMLLVAFGHSFIAEPIGLGVLTRAFPLGLGVIVLAVVLTGVYVVRANGEFDRLTAQVVAQRLTVGARSLERVR